MKKTSGRLYYRVSLFTFAILISILSLVIPFNLAHRPFQTFAIGTVSDQYIQAPYSIAYSSQFLTEAAKEQAKANTAPVYLPADPSIGQRQIKKVMDLLDFVLALRIEKGMTENQKLNEIHSLGSIPISINILRI